MTKIALILTFTIFLSACSTGPRYADNRYAAGSHSHGNVVYETVYDPYYGNYAPSYYSYNPYINRYPYRQPRSYSTQHHSKNKHKRNNKGRHNKYKANNKRGNGNRVKHSDGVRHNKVKNHNRVKNNVNKNGTTRVIKRTHKVNTYKRGRSAQRIRSEPVRSQRQSSNRQSHRNY